MQVPPGASAVADRRGTTLRLAVVAGAVVALDQATKAWALAALDDGPVELAGPAVRLRLSRNTGGAFSLLTGRATLLALVAAVLVVVIVRVARQEGDPRVATALALVLGGALGNLADRVFRDPGFLEGAVVDFVDVGPWPVFNVADTAIAVGAVLLVLASSRDARAGR